LSEALVKKGKLQVLCAHRHGKHGVTGWNRLVEERLGVATSNPWYAGRPVIVTVNDSTTKLFNGDVGIIGQGTKGRVAFFGGESATSTVPTTRLPHVDTVHALTIHKSQGSEYDHVIVVLPEQDSRILNRELFYTGVTRASSKLTILGSKESIEAAVSTKVRRATGLARRLRN
jgi:exodeoxyribonuclease V alpha subunit